MKTPDPAPTACGGLRLAEAVRRLPDGVGELLRIAAGQRLAELDVAVATGNHAQVVEVSRSLASLMGVLPIPELRECIRVLYSAATARDLATMTQVHRQLSPLLRCVLDALGDEKSV